LRCRSVRASASRAGRALPHHAGAVRLRGVAPPLAHQIPAIPACTFLASSCRASGVSCA
jgi:hypothetical protein